MTIQKLATYLKENGLLTALAAESRKLYGDAYGLAGDIAYYIGGGTTAGHVQAAATVAREA